MSAPESVRSARPSQAVCEKNGRTSGVHPIIATQTPRASGSSGSLMEQIPCRKLMQVNKITTSYSIAK
jgi:hypothetical protein